MATLLAEVEQQLLGQHQQLCVCDAGLSYLRNKSELCAKHAKVYYNGLMAHVAAASFTCIIAYYSIVNTEWNSCDLHWKHWL